MDSVQHGFPGATPNDKAAEVRLRIACNYVANGVVPEAEKVRIVGTGAMALSDYHCSLGEVIALCVESFRPLQQWLNAPISGGNALVSRTNAQVLFDALGEAERGTYRQGEMSALWQRLCHEALVPSK